MGRPALPRVRAWRRRLTFGLATAATVGGGALAGGPLHAAADVPSVPIPVTTVGIGGPSTFPTPPPGGYCNPPTLSVLDGDVGALHVVLDATSAAAQTAVCFRVDGLGVGLGGSLLVNADVTAGVPTVVDSNLCDGALLDQAPGPHPLIDENVGGQQVYFDSYSGPDSNGQIFVCASVGSVADTVVLPVGVGSQPLVTFVPDADTPVVG